MASTWPWSPVIVTVYPSARSRSINPSIHTDPCCNAPAAYSWVLCLILPFVRIGAQPHCKRRMYSGSTLCCAVYYVIDHRTDQAQRACPAAGDHRGVVCAHDVG